MTDIRVPTTDEVCKELRWSIWHAMNRHEKVCGYVSEERLDDCADSAMTMIRPVIEDFLGRLGALRATHRHALAEIDRLATQINGFTTQWGIRYDVNGQEYVAQCSESSAAVHASPGVTPVSHLVGPWTPATPNPLAGVGVELPGGAS